MKSCAWASRAAASICASLIARPIAMFSRALAASRNGSCGTSATAARKASSPMAASGWPSISRLPGAAS